MSRPAVSVVLPTHQRRERVRRAVESVLDQTFGDFELLVVDDGSTDGTGAALRGLDPRLRYVWQENRGVGAARNAGIRLAAAPVVAFLDSDDRWLPHHLETVIDALGRCTEAGLVATSSSIRLQSGEPVVIDLFARLLLGNAVTAPPCVAVRRSALLEVGGFDERFAVFGDGDLWLRLALRNRFCLIRAETWEARSSSSPDSIFERGVREGAYLEAQARSVEACLRVIPEVRPDEAPELVSRARGRLRFIAGLAALRAGDEATAAAALREALTLAPAFADDRAPVIGGIAQAALDGRTRRRYLAFVVGAWRGHPCFAGS